MFTDHRTARPRWAAAAVTPLAVLLLAVTPAVSHADTTREAQGATERLVDALNESPVYVDPSYASALPEDLARDVESRITDSGIPLKVVAVPLIEGGDWNGDASHLAAALHDRGGEEEDTTWSWTVGP